MRCRWYKDDAVNQKKKKKKEVKKFFYFNTAFLVECAFAVTSKRQGRSCHNSLARPRVPHPPNPPSLPENRAHDLLRYMTMLYCRWPHYRKTLYRAVRVSAPISRVPTRNEWGRLRSNMLSLDDGLRPDGKR